VRRDLKWYNSLGELRTAASVSLVAILEHSLLQTTLAKYRIDKPSIMLRPSNCVIRHDLGCE
jgi:hypothetical protein